MLNQAATFCDALAAPEYVVDCLAEQYARIAERIPASGEYADAQAAIELASRKLASLARANRDPNLPRGHAHLPGSNTPATSRPLTPVNTDALAEINAQALSILEEAETKLLRSGANSANRQLHYQRIADALGSNKVLLRS